MAEHGSVELASVDGRWVLRLSGEIDYEVSGEIVAAGRVAVRPLTDIVADLAEVSFIDSLGLGRLVEIRNAVHSGGKNFRLRNVPPNVARILSLTGLDEVLSAAGDDGADSKTTTG